MIGLDRSSCFFPRVCGSSTDRRPPATTIPNPQWCGPCQLLAGEMDKVAGLYKDKLRVLKVDSDEEPRIASALKVYGLPTVFFIKARFFCVFVCLSVLPNIIICSRQSTTNRGPAEQLLAKLKFYLMNEYRRASSCTVWRVPCQPRSSPSSSISTASAPRQLERDRPAMGSLGLACVSVCVCMRVYLCTQQHDGEQ